MTLYRLRDLTIVALFIIGASPVIAYASTSGDPQENNVKTTNDNDDKEEEEEDNDSEDEEEEEDEDFDNADDEEIIVNCESDAST